MTSLKVTDAAGSVGSSGLQGLLNFLRFLNAPFAEGCKKEIGGAAAQHGPAFSYLAGKLSCVSEKSQRPSNRRDNDERQQRP